MARTVARLPSGARIGDHVTLGVLTSTVPARLIDTVLADTGRQSRRQRRSEPRRSERQRQSSQFSLSGEIAASATVRQTRQ